MTPADATRAADTGGVTDSGSAADTGGRDQLRVMVRDGTIADWGDIWPFFRRIIAAGDTYCLPTVMMGSDARNVWFSGPRTTVLVAVDPTRKPRVINSESPIVGAVVGTASIHPNQQAAGDHIANASVMIDPDYAGRGIGAQLGVSVLARARREGYRGMQFNAVVETNTAAVKLWTSLGFEIVGTVPGAFRHPREGDVGLHIMYHSLR